MNKLDATDLQTSIAVMGGGMSGLTSAIEAAEAGYDVILLEKEPYLGGRVVRANEYFPKLCSPNCGLEINFRRIKTNPRIRLFTLAEVEKISGKEGAFEIDVQLKPRMVNDNCVACNKCTEVCEVDRPNDFNYGLDKTKAIYLPHAMAFPMKYIVDPKVCKGAECAKCVEACNYNAIELDMPVKKLKINAASVIVATGWKPYDASRLDNLGFGQYKNVITNVMMERLAAANGPTAGNILRPSDNKPVNSIAFVQCAGSRDENHLPYCSGVCCLGSLKQTTYVKDQNPEAKVSIFYIDIRAMGFLEDFFQRVQKYDGLSLIKGKVAKIREDLNTGDLTVEAEDIASGKKVKETFEMVVLATGMVPTTADSKVPYDMTYDNYGFITEEPAGIYGAGCIKRPIDVAASVQDATRGALKAIQSVVRGSVNG